MHFLKSNRFLPPRSPYGLIQEDLFPDAWKILIVSMLLNCTRRKQVERILPELFQKWPSPKELLAANQLDVATLCKPLGFTNRRTQNIFRMTERFVTQDWNDVRELPGVGEYCARSYEIFCKNMLGSEPPNDHALLQYYLWRKMHDCKT